MSDNSKTPRNKRLSNGPGASFADKYPEDSPTRLRQPPPRFPIAMQNQRRRRAHTQAQAHMHSQASQHVELRVGDTQAWPSLGEANSQMSNQQRRAAHAARSSSASPTPSDSQQIDALELSPEQRQLVESQVEAFRRNLLQQHTPTRGASVPERNLFQREQQARESPADLAATGPVFAPESIAGLMAAQQQQQLTTQNQQQGSPFRTFVPGQNSAYNFDSLAASQQAQREATAAQLHSAFTDSQPHRSAPVSQSTATVAQLHNTFIEPTYAQPTSTGARGQHNYGFQPGSLADYLSFSRHNALAETSATTSNLSQPMTGVLNPSAQGFRPQPEASTSSSARRGQINPSLLPFFNTGAAHNTQTSLAIAAPTPRAQASQYYLPGLTATGSSSQIGASAAHGEINPAYLPVFNTSTEPRSTPTAVRAAAPLRPAAPIPIVEPTPPELTWSAADYDVSPPPSPTQALPDLLNPTRRGALSPDPRPLTAHQQTGAHYGLEIGGMGSSLLGTSDRTNWLPSPWNQPGQQRSERVQPLGWEWLEERGRGARGDRK